MGRFLKHVCNPVGKDYNAFAVDWSILEYLLYEARIICAFFFLQKLYLYIFHGTWYSLIIENFLLLQTWTNCETMSTNIGTRLMKFCKDNSLPVTMVGILIAGHMGWRQLQESLTRIQFQKLSPCLANKEEWKLHFCLRSCKPNDNQKNNVMCSDW